VRRLDEKPQEDGADEEPVGANAFDFDEGGKGGLHGQKHGSDDAAELLRKKVFPFILRRKKEDVAKDLPPKEIITLYVDMTDRQRAVYETYRKAYLEKVERAIEERGLSESSMEILEAMLRLRQISIFPGLVKKEFAKAGSGKFEHLKDMLDDILHEGHKVLIFSQFVQALAVLRTHMDGLGLEYSYIDGSTKRRDAEIKKFQENDEVKVFLISLKAGGLGINLTAADYVILFDPWWNPAVENQAIDRAHRIGRTRKVIAYRLLMKNSIEEKIQELQQRKKKLADDIVSEDASFLKSLTRDDLLGLFE